MYPNPGSSPVCGERGDVREEEGVAARFQHQSREEESPDVSKPGFDPGMSKTRRRQGGGETSPRAFNTGIREEEYPVCQFPAFKAGIRCGDIREEERMSPQKYRSIGRRADLISVMLFSA